MAISYWMKGSSVRSRLVVKVLSCAGRCLGSFMRVLPSCATRDTLGCGEQGTLKRRLVDDRRAGMGWGERGEVSGMVPTVGSATPRIPGKSVEQGSIHEIGF